MLNKSIWNKISIANSQKNSNYIPSEIVSKIYIPTSYVRVCIFPWLYQHFVLSDLLISDNLMGVKL